MREIHSIEIKDEAQVGAVRRAVHNFARGQNFTEIECAEIDIVVQEIGTNAVNHATDGGTLHYAPLLDGKGLELFYWDTGPGIYDLDRAVRDGVSTSGSLGAGLGAIRRLTDEFEVYSTMRVTTRLSLANVRRTTHGTALLARKQTAVNKAKAHDGEALAINDSASGVEDWHKSIGLWSRPHPHEQVNGDAYLVRALGDATLFAVVDGLGHGRGAKQAADVAIASLNAWAGEPLDEVIHTVHDALRATRGAVIGACVVDRGREFFSFVGVGNVAARIMGTPRPMSLIPTHGTLGARLTAPPRVWTNQWTQGATIIMASDGLSDSWHMDAYPGLLQKHPQLIAGVLMRDYARATDDATVLVAR